MGEWRNGGLPHIPGGLKWGTEGIKILGVSLWTHVNLVLSSLLRIDWSVNPSLCLLNDDSGLCISSMQKRMLFAGFTAAKKTIIQNWFTPHMCRKTYWIRSLLQIVMCECATARVSGARPSTPAAFFIGYT